MNISPFLLSVFHFRKNCVVFSGSPTYGNIVSPITGGADALPLLKEVDSSFASVFALPELASERSAFGFPWYHRMMMICPSALKLSLQETAGVAGVGKDNLHLLGKAGLFLLYF